MPNGVMVRESGPDNGGNGDDTIPTPPMSLCIDAGDEGGGL